LFAGVIGENAVAAQSVLMQLLVISFMFPLGVGISASTLVGNALGAGKITLARELAHLSLKVMVGLSCIICPTMAIGGHYFMSLFTTDQEVLGICTSTLKYLVYSAFVDGLQGVASGILRGAGKQHIGAITNVIAFYALGLPCAWLMCFELGFGVHGLMIGILLGSSFQTAVLLYFVLFRDAYVFRRLVTSGTTRGIAISGEEHNDAVIRTLAEDHAHISRVEAYTISSSCGALAPNHMLIPGV
jgi:Na+-driven multidrug efflux pump